MGRPLVTITKMAPYSLFRGSASFKAHPLVVVRGSNSPGRLRGRIRSGAPAPAGMRADQTVFGHEASHPLGTTTFPTQFGVHPWSAIRGSRTPVDLCH